MESLVPVFSVSDFIATTNQTLEYAYPSVEIEGEVSGFKINQGKFVFFDLKDTGGSLGCFMMAFALRIPIEDGMKVTVRAQPKLTNWGKFSLTVQRIRPSGEGSIKKSFELLKAKLVNEGLFSAERKRALPAIPKRIGVISSTQAAGYADFIKILDERWGNVAVDVAHVQVQGESAPDQIIRALSFFNEQEQLVDVLVIVRGGGSADDLAAFNDEPLVRMVASSRIPILTGIGHEIDESLVDLAADRAASTPSNAAQILVPDKVDVARHVRSSLSHILTQTERSMYLIELSVQSARADAFDRIEAKLVQTSDSLRRIRTALDAYNPSRVLERGYAIIRGEYAVGAQLDIETARYILKTEVQHVNKK